MNGDEEIDPDLATLAGEMAPTGHMRELMLLSRLGAGPHAEMLVEWASRIATDVIAVDLAIAGFVELRWEADNVVMRVTEAGRLAAMAIRRHYGDADAETPS